MRHPLDAPGNWGIIRRGDREIHVRDPDGDTPGLARVMVDGTPVDLMSDGRTVEQLADVVAGLVRAPAD